MSYLPIQTNDNIIIKTGKNLLNRFIGKNNSGIHEALNYLMREKNFTNEENDKINSVIGKVNNVTDMTKEFGLPTTTILRGYEKYNNIFNSLKK